LYAPPHDVYTAPPHDVYTATV